MTPEFSHMVFFVRAHGTPDDDTEHNIEEGFCDVLDEYKEKGGWGILTIGRQYFHKDPKCHGCPQAKTCNYV